MKKAELLNLDLRTPLFYAKLPDLPSALSEKDEILLCFDLDPVQSRSIEPDPQQLVGKMVFAGRKQEGPGGLQAETVALEKGNYLFCQCRDADAPGASPFAREEWLEMAIEQQKDGLWERYNPGNLLYVRFLFEDGCRVTQVLRESL